MGPGRKRDSRHPLCSAQIVEERIELAHELRPRFRLATPTLIHAVDNRAWHQFGSANVAMLVHPHGRIAVKQASFEPQEMACAITALLKISAIRPDDRISRHE